MGKGRRRRREARRDAVPPCALYWPNRRPAPLTSESIVARHDRMTVGPEGAICISNFGYGAPPGLGQILQVEFTD
jgi:hypothetical protein